MNFEKLKRSKIFNVNIDSTMRLIFRYSLFSSVLLLGLSQIVCADIRVPASIAAEKARRKPPANVSNYVLQSNSNGITLTWTNPTDSDFSKILILKNTSPIVNSPTRGRTYANGDSIGSSSVMYNAVRSSFTDTEIIEGVAYFYKIFSYDTRLNYASGVELELDQIPPANVTNHVLQRNSNGIILTWTNPADSDFSKVLILRHTSPIVDSPARGQDYASGDSIGSSSVVYNGDLETLQITGNEANILHYYKIFAYDTNFNYASGFELSGPRDGDGDGLIEIHNLTELHNIRYDLAGTSYKTSASDAGDSSGCPVVNGSEICHGYELTQSLSFDKDGDGTTWSGDSTNGYTLDAGDNASPHFIVADGGWKPIGKVIINNNGDPHCNNNTCFNAIFEGNGHTITGLASIRSEEVYVGLFGSIGNNARIRNVGLIDNLVNYTGSQASYVGGLVGFQFDGSITASYATGSVDGGDGHDGVGGLVGYQDAGNITGSYATGSVDGGDGSDGVGGLVGLQFDGSITASYATESVDGGEGDDRIGGLVGESHGSITGSYATGSVDGGIRLDNVGGLVGLQFDGSITASYATGSVDGGSHRDAIGGLVGLQFDGSITGSYATGSIDGEDGSDSVGGLVGDSTGSITASYATGSVDGGEGTRNLVGGLVGTQQDDGNITGSYATGAVDGGDGSDDAGGLVGASSGSITASYAAGAVDGGDGTDRIGGLVGQHGDGSITASYATGSVDGGAGIDRIGGLVGFQSGGSIITASYGFGAIVNGETPNTLGAPPTGVSSAINLTSTNTPTSWNDATKATKDAWDFGTSSQIPALKYADYDGAGTTGTAYYCDSVTPTPASGISIPNCGTLLLGQR